MEPDTMVTGPKESKMDMDKYIKDKYDLNIGLKNISDSKYKYLSQD